MSPQEYRHAQYVVDRLRREVQTEQLAGWSRADAIVTVAERHGVDPFKVRDLLA